MEKSKFLPNSNILLIEPAALGLEFILAGPQILAPFEKIGNAAVVKVSGPLSYSNFMFDSYEAIKGRVAAAAAATDCSVIILRIASPGGDVAGAFDCARALKAIAKGAGKKLITYTDENACSAAYAIMCVGDEICASVTGKVGHIGAIAQYAETTAADKAQGIVYHTFTTGSLKASGNPHVNMSEEQSAAIQAQLEQAGEVFYRLVAEHRPLGADAIQALQAGTFLGEAAKSVGLIDKVYSWDELISYVENSATIQAKATSEGTSKEASAMPDQEDKKDSKAKAEDKEDKKEDMKSLLTKAAAAGDAKAAKALKAYESDDEKDKAKAEEDDKKKKEEAKAADDKEDKKEDKAIAALAAELAASRAESAALKSRLDAQDAAKSAAERSAFFASIGASEALIKGFEGLPLDRCKEILSASSFKSQAPQLAGQPVQGSTAEGATVSVSANSELNRQMGLTKVEMTPVKYDGVVQSFNVHEFRDQ